MLQSEDVSVIGTEDDDDRSLISLLNSTETQNMYHSEVTFKVSVTLICPFFNYASALSIYLLYRYARVLFH
jgi:hypothetical protein